MASLKSAPLPKKKLIEKAKNALVIPRHYKFPSFARKDASPKQLLAPSFGATFKKNVWKKELK